MSSALPWSVLLVPLISAVVILLFTRRSGRVSSFVSVLAALSSLLCSWALFTSESTRAIELTWIDLRPLLYVPLGFVIDGLSKTMLLVVTGVGALIHVYSLGYMRDDAGKSRYFASLSLFMFSMIGIVLSNNFVMMF
ncbi:MAG TPA: hypothetical protein VGQ82_10880, partial [Chthoniobacterales bacterium]|nr:hypothetical protein [Chthoniobacterales bacterium]